MLDAYFSLNLGKFPHVCEIIILLWFHQLSDKSVISSHEISIFLGLTITMLNHHFPPVFLWFSPFSYGFPLVLKRHFRARKTLSTWSMEALSPRRALCPWQPVISTMVRVWDDPVRILQIACGAPQFGIAFSWCVYNFNFTMVYGRYI